VIAPALSGSEVLSIDQVDAKILRAKKAFARSRHAIAAAHDDLENHQRWLNRLRAAWAENAKRHERQLNRRLWTWALKRLGLGLLLIGPITCLALFRFIARFLPSVRDRLFSSVSWFALARLTRKRASSLLHVHAAKSRNTSGHRYRIRGLDGPLCTGQPASSNVIPKPETCLLQARLVVASFAAVVVGFLAAATTPDRHTEPAQVPPNTLVHAGQTAPLPPVPSNELRDAGGSAPSPLSGFAVLAATPAAERVSPAGATIAEIISITRPLTEKQEQPKATTTELLKVPPPVRKPKIKVKLKRSPTTPKHEQTLWDQLPWLRAR
jgi:hypothetical protein